MRFDRIDNVRDIGGLRASSGGVRSGLVFRSGHLGNATRRDVSRLEALGLRTSIDLRSHRDAGGRPPDRLPGGVRLVECPVSGDHAGWRALATRDPTGIWRHVLRPGASEHLLRETYRMHALDHAASFGDAVNALAASDALPAVVHCRQGKDRTGWLVAILLDLLGVEREAIVDEYLLSNRSAPPIIAGPLVRRALRPMVRVDASWLIGAFAAVIDVHGSMEGYRRAAGVEADTDVVLRSRLLAT